jgi:hypothetical protein
VKFRIIGVNNFLSVLVASLSFFNAIDAVYSQDIRWLRVGQLQSFFVDYGSENELSPLSTNSFSWPAQYGDNQHTSRMKSLWMGAQNFYDPIEYKTKTVKVVGSGPRYDQTNQPGMIFSKSVKLIGRENPPEVSVDGQPAAINHLYDILDEVDPTLPCDRMIVIKFNTSMGVSVTKKILAFSQQNHNNYFVYEYIFKNTGIYNAAGDVYFQTLNNFWIHFGYHYAFAGVTSSGWGSTWGAFSSEWGASTLLHDFGPFRTPTSDTLRGFYAFYAPNKDRIGLGLSSYDQDWGCPNQNGGGVGLNGLLGSAKYSGVVTLYAPVSVQNPVDDPLQPVTTSYYNTDDNAEKTPVSQYDEVFMQQRYTTMSEGHLAQSMEETVGSQWPADFWTANQSGRYGGMQGQGYGPYTLAPGDSIRIIFAEGISGMSWEKCREVGAVWYEYYKGTSTPPLVFPAGKTGTNYTDYSKAWVQSGKDSLLQTFRNARTNFRSGYQIPQPPSAPNNFSVESGGDRIRLSWTPPSSTSNLAGYVIYRSENYIKDYRAFYTKIFECDASMNEWYDTTAVSGRDYYYYIQSKDEGTRNDLYPGTPLYSSMFLTMTNSPAGLHKIHDGEFRSHQSGNWNNVSSWERFNGSVWVYPSPYAPSNTDTIITILNGHAITVTTADSADQFIVKEGGNLVIAANATFKVTDGDSTDMLVLGTVSNYGLMTQDVSASIQFGTTSSGEVGKYIHRLNGGSIPIATWKQTSVCEITGVTDTIPSNIRQNFSKAIWNCPNQSGNFALNMASCGTLTILNTNWDHESPYNPSHYLSLCNINGAFYIGQLNVTGPHSALIEQDGNYNDTISTGSIAISNGGLLLLSNNTDGTIVNSLWSSFTCPDSGYFGTANTSVNSAVIFTSSLNEFSVPSSGFTYLGSPHYRIATGSIFTIGTSILSGTASLSVDSGATIKTSHPLGLNGNFQVTGIKTFNKGAGYYFTGSSTQITGVLMPDTVRDLSIENASGVTLTSSVVINGSLGLLNGIFSEGTKNITVNGSTVMGNGSFDEGGNPLTYGNNASLIYSGTSSRSTSNAEFPLSNGPKNLTVRNIQGVTLHASRILPGSLNLASNSKLYLGLNSIVAASATTSDTNSYVVTDSTGSCGLSSVGTTTMLLPIGTKNAYAPVWVTNSGTLDAISARVADDLGTPVGGGRVKAKWEINESTAGGGNYTIRLGWMRKLEDATFYSSSPSGWRIFRLSDTTQIFTSGYTRPSMVGGRSIQHASITTLGKFTVGTFTGLTDVEEFPIQIPLAFTLRQNYPNPFNPSTKISFDIPSKSFVTLKIYDLLGREVKTLSSELLSVGNYTRIWNANGFASGIYFYRIQAGSFVETKKLVLIK